MSDFYAQAQAMGLQAVDTPDDVPTGPGVYMLFAENSLLVYVGKATNLRDRVSYHFSPREENALIHIMARFYIVQPTSTVEEAEMLEGALYDDCIDSTGSHPICNRQPPPKSKRYEEEGYHARLLRIAMTLKPKEAQNATI